ncbi:outer membrane protein transport protein, partial [Thiorhodospira sibirica]
MLTLPGLTHAAGFYIQEQSVSGLGGAFAGDAALAADASKIFFNPAG